MRFYTVVICPTINDICPFISIASSGHLDPGEDYRTAALRETEEEAGYTSDQLTVTDFQSTLNYTVRNRPKEVVYWLAELKDPNAAVKLSNEHQAFKWCDLEEACTLSGYSDMEKVLRDADKYLKS